MLFAYGTHFVFLNTLLIAKLSSKYWFKQDGAFFLDRDPKTFTLILSYLRSGHIPKSCYNILDQLMKEVEFFQLKGLKAKIQEVCQG